MADLSSLSWLEAKRKILKSEGVLVPIGSVEQHGDQLPLNTDNTICMRLIEGLSEKYSLCYVPIVTYGQTWSSSDYAGTISIEFEHLVNYLEDVLRSLQKAGAKRIILYSFHNGNMETIRQCARRFNDFGNVYYLHSNDLGKLAGSLIESDLPGGIWHASEVETSMMMFLDDCEVNHGKLGFSRINENISDLKPVKWDQFNESGSFGDTGKSTADKGRKIFSLLMQELGGQLERILKDKQRLKNIRLVVTDIDGTLVDSKGTLSSGNINSINELRDNGISFCLASGRNNNMMKGIAAAVGNNAYSISDNGALVYDHKNSRAVDMKCLDETDAKQILEYLLNHKVGFICYTINSMYFTAGSEIPKKKVKSVEIEAEKYGFNNTMVYKEVQCISDINETDKLLKIAILTESVEDMNEICTELKKYNVSTESTGTKFQGVFAKGVSKETGLKKLQNYLGIYQENTVAFGDFDNDLPLFNCAKYKVAVENANDCLLRKCNRMTRSNDCDGVAAFINDMII